MTAKVTATNPVRARMQRSGSRQQPGLQFPPISLREPGRQQESTLRLDASLVRCSLPYDLGPLESCWSADRCLPI